MFEVVEHEPASREHKARRTLIARWPSDDVDDYLRATKFAEGLTKRHGTTHAVLWNGREQVRFEWRRGVRRIEGNPRTARKVTRPGKHGTLTLYSITYTADPYDPGFGTAKVRLWAYDRAHAIERFDDDDGWRALSITEVRR